MPKKKQEMTQLYNSSNNEFIFGENGGKGKHLSSFLKNLSLTGSSSNTTNHHEANSNIYGNMAYSTRSPSPLSRSVSGPVGTSFSYASSTPPEGSTTSLNDTKQRPTSKRSLSYNRNSGSGYSVRHIPKYTDLDDDWDADIDDIAKKDNHHVLQPSPMLDSLYPDLTLPAANIEERVLTEKSPKPQNVSYGPVISSNKTTKFYKILNADANINIQDLRKLSWNGVPPHLRAITWQILLGYLPTNKSRQASTLKRKRQEYWDGLGTVDQIEPTNDSVASLESSNNNSSANRDKQLYHQIKIDVKRTNPTIKLYSYEQTQQSLRRILYLWAIRHPASGYVQGINDLCTPFYQIFLSNYLWQLKQVQNNEQEEHAFIPGLLDPEDEKQQQLLEDNNLQSYNLDNFDPAKLSTRVTSIIEADTYWCLSRLLENITDNYIHEQPGILRQVKDLRNLISKIDLELLQHFDKEGIEFIQFAFRWMNCLLMRELSIDLIVRMWDTYLSETPLGFNNFHIYVCAAFLIKFSAELKEKDFQEILLFLQNPPTSSWREKDIELMLSEAFIWQSLYKNASAHLR